MEFDWDEGNIHHIIDKHKIYPEEIIEIIYNRPVLVSKGITKGEYRYRIVGMTDKGRVLTIVYTYRDNKLRPVTAFDSGLKDIRKYRGRKGHYEG